MTEPGTDQRDTEQPSLAAPLWRLALRCVCPRCGQGRLYQGFLTLRPLCEVCGLDIASTDSGDGPAVFLIFVLGIVVVPPALIISLHMDWPLWLNALVWGTVLLGCTLGMLRPAKAAVFALNYRHRAGQ